MNMMTLVLFFYVEVQIHISLFDFNGIAVIVKQKKHTYVFPFNFYNKIFLLALVLYLWNIMKLTTILSLIFKEQYINMLNILKCRRESSGEIKVWTFYRKY